MKLLTLILISIHLISAIKPKSPFELDKIETDDFMTLLANKVLVDKTLLLVTGILYPMNYGGSLIIHRPEGWGKSTYMNMLDKYFRIEIDERGQPKIPKETVNNKLFLGGHIKFGPKDDRIFHRLNICHHAFQVKFLGTRAVIFLKLGNITGGSYQEIRDQIRARIWDLVEEHSYVEYGDREYHKFWESEDYFIGALYILGQKLNTHFTRRDFITDVITLVDDYDAPLINAYLEFGDKPEEVEKVRQLLVDIYTALTEKSNMFRTTVIFMGVLDAVVSDFLHFRKEFKKASYHQDIHTDYAFLPEEIDQLVNRSFNQVDAQEMKNWCCGNYDFFDKPLCQPRASMLYLAQNGNPSYYQSNSSISRLVDKIISSEDFQDKIQSLIPINASIYHQIHPENQTNDNQLVSFYPLDGITILYHSGHLSTQKSLGKNHLTITTNATRYLFQAKVLQFIFKKFGIDSDEFHSFAKLLSTGNLKKFKLMLQKYLSSVSTYIQQGVKEAKLICDGLRIALYHSLLSTHDLKFIKQNVEEGDLGFVNEVLLIPKPGSENVTSVVIKQKSDLKGTYTNSITRPPKFKGPLEFLYNDFYHEKNMAMNINSADDRVNINVILQNFTAEIISVVPEFKSIQFFMSFRLTNVTDASNYSSLNDEF